MVSMRKLVKGIDTIILSEDGRGGFVSIEAHKLTTKLEDLYDEDTLARILEGIPGNPREMPLIAWIKRDITSGNKGGWAKHRDALLNEGFDA